MKNILLTIEYDGTNFHGWQRQPHCRTVQGELEKALSSVCRAPITIDGTSRTDAGVHAHGQRASFCGDFGIPVERIPLAVNNFLAGGMNSKTLPDVRIVDACQVEESFHARFDSKGKKYIYKIAAGDDLSIFERNYFYQMNEMLDIELMREGAKYIVGTHDFKCFQASGGEEKSTTVRTIYGLDIYDRSAENASADSADGQAGKQQNIEIEIKGDGFLYNMVRIITGTLVEVGLGKRTPESIKDVIVSKDRSMAGHTAPPQGLYLAEVYYNTIG